MKLNSGSFQISSTAAETDFLKKSMKFNKDLNGTELRKLPDLLYTGQD